MQPKFKVGDMVKVLRGEYTIATPGKRVIYDCKDLVGRVTGVERMVARFNPFCVSGYGEGYRYDVEVHIEKMPRTIKVAEDDVTTVSLGELMDFFDVENCTFGTDGKIVMSLKKKSGSGVTEEQARKLNSLIDDLRNDVKERIQFVPPFSKSFLDNPFLTDDLRNKIHEFGKIAVDMAKKGPEPKKMEKSRCIKLLESYRAEREKVKKGRRFERCLRDSVVDEALERAIELLKGGES